MEQLLLFKDPEELVLRRQVQMLQDKLDRQRKSQYAKIAEQKKAIEELKSEFVHIKAAICKEKSNMLYTI